MPAALLKKAFQPFVSTKQGGTGLGLAIVRRLVELHGGGVDIESTAQIGTTVRVTLPLERVPGQDSAAVGAHDSTRLDRSAAPGAKD